MTKKLFILPALLAVVAVFTFTSCGDDCKFDQKDYVGSYLVDEDCSRSPQATYTVVVSAGASETDVKLSNVWGAFGASVNATIDCEVITIPRQEPDGDKFFVEGSGIISKDGSVTTINFTYKVTDETDAANIVTDECNSTIYTKL